jgi:hypothetical protein
VFFDLNDEWISIKKVTYPAGITSVDDEKIVVFPNPNQGIFSIQLPNNQVEAEIEIVSALGQVVYTGLVTHKTPISIAGISKGTYVVKIKTNEKMIVKKMLVD